MAEKKSLDNYRQSLTLRKEADTLASQAQRETDFERSLPIYDKAIEKYKKSLTLYSPPDAETVSRQIWNLEYGKQDRMVKKYWADGQALEKAGKIVEAIGAYDKAIASFHPTVLQKDRMWITTHQQELKNRVNGAQSWRADGDAKQKAGKIAEAIQSYRKSISLLPDAALEAYIKTLEGQLAADNAKRGTADRLWTEGSNLYKQGKEQDALAKLKESLGYWSSPERTKYVQDLQNQIARREALCKNLWEEGSRLQSANRLADALVKYRECQKQCPTNEMAQHIQKLEAKLKETQDNESRKAAALKLRQEGDTLVRQNMIADAVARYKQSLQYWPDGELEKYVRTLEVRLSGSAQTGGPTQKQQCQLYGEYSGTVTGGGATGRITLVVSTNNRVTGTSSGTLDGDQYTASISGTFDPSSGSVQATLQGNVAPKGLTQKYPFNGDVTGKYQGGTLRGQWKGASTYGNPAGSWNAPMQRPVNLTSPCPSGTGQSPSPQKGAVIFEISNVGGVMNNPSRPSTFTVQNPYQITLIQNYHWNNGRGAPPGTIALKDQSGRTFGPWRTSGLAGSGSPNVAWVCNPNITLPGGTYTVIDSDPGTWAHNGQSGDRGFTRIEGYPAQGAQGTGSTSPIVTKPPTGAETGGSVPPASPPGSEKVTLKVRALIDGRSHLVIQGNALYWKHYDYAAPGRQTPTDQPTYVNGASWLPSWPNKPNRENRDCKGCESSRYTAIPALLQQNQTVGLNIIKAREKMKIVQQPAPGNQYTLIVEFNDTASGGSEWYEIGLSYLSRR